MKRFLGYVLICWGLPLLIAFLLSPSLVRRGPIEVRFDTSKIRYLELKVLEQDHERNVVVFPNPHLQASFTLFQSKILKMTAIGDVSETQVIVKNPDYDDSVKITLKGRNGKLESEDLNIEKNPIGVAHASGVYLAFVLLFSVAFGFAWLIKRRREFKKEILFGVLLLLPIAYLAQLHWPGHMSYDSLVDYRLGLNGQNNSYTQIFYSSLHIAFIDLWRSLATGMLFNLSLMLVLFVSIYSQTRKDWTSFLLFLGGFSFLWVSKINQQLMIFQNRDITFTWIFVLFLFTVARPQSRWFLRIFLFLLSAFLRKETLLLLPLYLFFEIRRGPTPTRTVLGRFLLPTLILAAYYGGSSYVRNLQLDSQYTATSYLNPMMYIIARHGKTVLTADEQAAFAAIGDIDQALAVHKDLDIEEAHRGALKAYLLRDPKNERRLRKVALRLIRDYPLDWLKNRALLGAGILGLLRDTYWFNNEAYANPIFSELAVALPTRLHSDPVAGWRTVYSAQELLWYRVLLASALPALLVILSLLGLWARAPLTSAASVLVVARFFIILVFAPAAYYKYVWSLTVWGPFVPCLLHAEMVHRRLRSSPS